MAISAIISRDKRDNLIIYCNIFQQKSFFLICEITTFQLGTVPY